MPLQKLYYLTIPLKNRDMSPVAVVVEDDLNGNKFIMTLTHDGQPFDLTGASRVTFTVLKGDGNAVVGDATVESAAGGVVSYVLHQQCLSYPGVVMATVEVYSDAGETRITSTQFTFEVKGQLDDGSSIPSQEEYPVLQQLIIDTSKVVNTEHVGNYDPATSYKMNNIVSYLGSSYMAVQDCTGQAPVVGGVLNSAYWKLTASKGDPGAVMNPRGAYSDVENYNVNDLVTYSGNTYYCLQPCTGISPENTEYWEFFVGGAVPHNSLDGLNEGDYQHFTQAEKTNLIAHLADGMPHKTTDPGDNKVYRWGIGVQNGVWGINYEEVV